MKRVWVYLLSFLVFVVIMKIYYETNYMTEAEYRQHQTKQAKPYDYSIEAYMFMEDFVKERLKSPATAKFPSALTYRKHIEKMGNNQYRIDSWVDAQNSFGATIRSNFAGIVQRTSDSWKLIALKIY